MASKVNKGGHPFDAFVATHFTKTGERHPKTKQWHVQCKYCLGENPLLNIETYDACNIYRTVQMSQKMSAIRPASYSCRKVELKSSQDS